MPTSPVRPSEPRRGTSHPGRDGRPCQGWREAALLPRPGTGREAAALPPTQGPTPPDGEVKQQHWNYYYMWYLILPRTQRSPAQERMQEQAGRCWARRIPPLGEEECGEEDEQRAPPQPFPGTGAAPAPHADGHGDSSGARKERDRQASVIRFPSTYLQYGTVYILTNDRLLSSHKTHTYKLQQSYMLRWSLSPKSHDTLGNAQMFVAQRANNVVLLRNNLKSFR